MNKRMIITVVCFAVLYIGFADKASAQRKEIKKEQVPTAIINAIQIDFPAWNMENTKWYADNQEVKEWAPLDENVNRYIVEASGKNYKIHAVYNNKGKLRYSKTTIKDSALPRPILNRLASDEEYKGWALTGSQEVIRDFKEDTQVFKVYLEKDGDTKTFRFNRQGERVKRRIHIGE